MKNTEIYTTTLEVEIPKGVKVNVMTGGTLKFTVMSEKSIFESVSKIRAFVADIDREAWAP